MERKASAYRRALSDVLAPLRALIGCILRCYLLAKEALRHQVRAEPMNSNVAQRWCPAVPCVPRYPQPSCSICEGAPTKAKEAKRAAHACIRICQHAICNPLLRPIVGLAQCSNCQPAFARPKESLHEPPLVQLINLLRPVAVLFT